GAEHGLLESDHRNHFTLRHFSNLKDALDAIGWHRAPDNWQEGETIEVERGKRAIVRWSRQVSPEGFQEAGKPVVGVDWYMAQAWALAQGGLFLLTDEQWKWSAKGAWQNLEYATPKGQLFNSHGNRLAHCSVREGEKSTIDVD